MMITNKLLLSLATVLMLFSINTVQANDPLPGYSTPNDTPNGRYNVHGPHADGTQTVTDTVTELIWQQCSVGQTGTDCSVGTASTHTWQGALGLAASANVVSTAGYSNWRLPNIKELRSLVAYDRFAPTINGVVFPNTQSATYWSSSPDAGDSGSAWSVDFDDDYYKGRRGVGYDSRSDSNNVRLVRSPQ